MLTEVAMVFREAFTEVLAQKPTPPVSNAAKTAWELQKEAAQKIMVRICIAKATKWFIEFEATHELGKLAVRLRKMRDSVDDIDNEFYGEGCTIWAKVIRRHPLLDDVIERVLGEDLDPNIPQLIALQLEAFEELDD
ncbi:hypothetical protein TWF718_006627 [Orbilia javanica]|uniref:Uncharacterized protein n=1 Tax=Orbilia javanica TaxID=47235 RepID=A0AAN8N1G1_9PEZI